LQARRGRPGLVRCASMHQNETACSFRGRYPRDYLWRHRRTRQVLPTVDRIRVLGGRQEWPRDWPLQGITFGASKTN